METVNAGSAVASVVPMSKFGMGLLGLALLASAIWVGYYAQGSGGNPRLWPIVMLDAAGFLFSLGAFFKIAVRRAPEAAKDAEPPRPPMGEPASTEQKVR